MAMGKLKKHKQQALFIAAADLPRGVSHPFYAKLNEVLAGWKFDEFVERLCVKFYHDTMGRPGLEPGRYFRLLLLGYFEGIDSERGIAWRCSDSMSVRSFIGYALDELVELPSGEHLVQLGVKRVRHPTRRSAAAMKSSCCLYILSLPIAIDCPP